MEESRKRIRRPKPGRTAPLREFSTLFTKPARSAPASAPPDGARTERRQGPSNEDVLHKSVSMGYSVLQEQIDRARRLAQQMSPTLREGGESTDDITRLFRRMLRFSTDFGGLLFDVTEMMTRGSSPGPNGGSSSVAGSKPSANGAGSRLSVEIETPRRSRVTLDLGATGDGDGLLVPGLYAIDGLSPPLTQISFTAGALKVEIPDDQPPGTYTGAIIDDKTHEPRGTLSVRLER